MMMFSLDSHGDKQHKHASVFLPGEPHVDILHYDIHDDDGYGRYNLENIVYKYINIYGVKSLNSLNV